MLTFYQLPVTSFPEKSCSDWSLASSHYLHILYSNQYAKQLATTCTDTAFLKIFWAQSQKSDLRDSHDSSEMPDSWNVPYAITHVQPFSHAFPLIIVPSPSSSSGLSVVFLSLTLLITHSSKSFRSNS